MKYAVSDLHGCYEKYIKLLDMINFSPEDELYVLGDVCDRGDGGMEILFDMLERPNVIPIKGNHDYLAARLLQKLGTEYNGDEETLKLLRLWLLDGAKPTIDGFLGLSEKDRGMVIAYLRTFQYYEYTEAGGKRFFLSHTLPEYVEGNSISDYSVMEFVVGEPDYSECYLPGAVTVTGHTPTGLIDPACSGKIWHGKDNIVIDCGAVFGNPLGCLCLDTMEEFYAV